MLCTYSNLIVIGMALMSKKVVCVLRSYFSRGFRLNSTIEERRFKQFYEKQYSSEFPATLQLSMMIPMLGIQHENKVYLRNLCLLLTLGIKFSYT